MSTAARGRPFAQLAGVVLVTVVMLALIELGAGLMLGARQPPAKTPEMPGDTVSRTLAWLEINPAPLVRDADLLWRNEPNARKTQPMNPQPWGRNDTWTVENDSEGFRGPELGPDTDTTVYRILCIGDSITFGFNVDQPDAYPRQLQRLLEERYPGRRVEIINAGVPGWSWLQGLRFLDLRGLALHPDLVIMGHGTNDQMLPAKVTDEERFHRLDGPVAHVVRAAAIRLTATNSYRLVEHFFPPPPFSPEQDSPACKKQIAVGGSCHRVSVDEITLANLDFVETPAVQGIRRAAERDAIPFVDTVDRVRTVRKAAEDARAVALGLAPASAPAVGAPGQVSQTPQHVVVRVQAPDRDARYEVRGSGLYVAGFEVTAPCYDDGSHGDEKAGDGVYSARIEVPPSIPRVQYLFYRNDEPELRPLPPMASTVGNRLVLVTGDLLEPIATFGQLDLMAERAHPSRDGQRIVANAIADELPKLPSFRRFVGLP